MGRPQFGTAQGRYFLQLPRTARFPMDTMQSMWQQVSGLYVKNVQNLSDYVYNKLRVSIQNFCRATQHSGLFTDVADRFPVGAQ